MPCWKQKTSYSEPSDWVFPSSRMKGKQPRVGICWHRPAIVLTQFGIIRINHHVKRKLVITRAVAFANHGTESVRALMPLLWERGHYGHNTFCAKSAGWKHDMSYIVEDSLPFFAIS